MLPRKLRLTFSPIPSHFPFNFHPTSPQFPPQFPPNAPNVLRVGYLGHAKPRFSQARMPYKGQPQHPSEISLSAHPAKMTCSGHDIPPSTKVPETASLPVRNCTPCLVATLSQHFTWRHGSAPFLGAPSWWHSTLRRHCSACRGQIQFVHVI